MIESARHNHNLPNCEYVKVYYTDNYTILEKQFSHLDFAKPFIEKLKVNPDFHFIEFRIVSERRFKV